MENRARLPTRRGISQTPRALDTYQDWNPAEKKGLNTFLEAANQLQYSFTAKGKDSSELSDSQAAILEIALTRMQPQCRLHLEYSAWYSSNTSGKADKSGTAWIINLDSEAGTADMVDYGHNWLLQIDEKSNVSIEDGKLIIRFKPREEVFKGGFRPDLHALTCKIRLDVQGDGDLLNGGENGTIVVPSTKAGERWLRVEVVFGGQVRSADDDRKSSFKYNDLS